jgi:hypothetical protein
MKRTHRTLLVLNYAVTEYETDGFYYCEWDYLKKILTRPELIQLIRNVRQGKNYIIPDNGTIHAVEGV